MCEKPTGESISQIDWGGVGMESLLLFKIIIIVIILLIRGLLGDCLADVCCFIASAVRLSLCLPASHGIHARPACFWRRDMGR